MDTFLENSSQLQNKFLGQLKTLLDGHEGLIENALHSEPNDMVFSCFLWSSVILCLKTFFVFVVSG